MLTLAVHVLMAITWIPTISFARTIAPNIIINGMESVTVAPLPVTNVLIIQQFRLRYVQSAVYKPISTMDYACQIVQLTFFQIKQ